MIPAGKILAAGPWMLYAGLSFMGRPDTGAMLAVCLWIPIHWSKRRELPELEWAFGFFFLCGAGLGAAAPEMLKHHAGTLLFGVLCGMSLLTTLLSRPFVLRYAKNDIEESHWQHPQFLRVVDIVAWFWTGAFFLAAALSGFYGPRLAPRTWPVLAMTGACMAGAAAFTWFFPKWYRKAIFPLPVAPK
jgi:uncharacterized membrane protein YfcA